MRKVALLTSLIVAMVYLASCYPFGAGGGWDTEKTPPVTTTPTTPIPTVATANGTGAVSIDGFAYTPTTLVVTKGTTVTWTNKYPLAHRVIATKEEFASADIRTGASFSWTFKESGNYTYYCSIHPTMKGTVIVE